MSNALAVIESARKQNALVFVNQENFQTGIELYKTEATIIQSKPEEFHNLQGKYMPNRAVTDRIGEAAGVQFVAGEVRAETRDDEIAGKRTVFVGTAQGKVRMPDGSWRLSALEEYEFDPTLRAMLDKKIDYITDTNRGTFARTALEYTKVARQRAATGARLRVIRQLTGMPVNFTQNEISRPMVFTRVVQNTAHILESKEGKTLATMQALGMTAESLYGKKPVIEEERVEQMAPMADDDSNLRQADTSEFDSEPSTDTADLASQANPAGDELNVFQNLTVDLESLIDSHKEALDRDLRSGQNPYKSAKAELDDFSATVESRKSMIERTKKFLTTIGVAV